MEHLKYPIGKYQRENWPHPAQNIETIRTFPERLEALLLFLDGKMHLSYRPGGWSAIQIIHHLADSHSNAYIRVKLALTEENPTIKPYDENAWAALPDANNPDIQSSLTILKGIHIRLCDCLSQLSESQLDRTYFHPEAKKPYTLREMTSLYAWHCEQHLAHLKIIAQPA